MHFFLFRCFKFKYTAKNICKPLKSIIVRDCSWSLFLLVFRFRLWSCFLVRLLNGSTLPLVEESPGNVLPTKVLTWWDVGWSQRRLFIVFYGLANNFTSHPLVVIFLLRFTLLFFNAVTINLISNYQRIFVLVGRFFFDDADFFLYFFI